MKNILIATDFSKEAYCALHYATQLFGEKESKYYIAYFIGDKIHASVYSGIKQQEFNKVPQLIQDSEVNNTATLHRIVRDSGFSAGHFETISSENKLGVGIKELIASRQIDVVVMGTKKHDGLLESITGTHTTRIIDSSLPVPLLVVPRELDFTGLRNIAFASELIYDFNFEALELLKDIALSHGARICLVHDGDETEMSQRQWRNYNAFKTFFGEVPVGLEFYHSHHEVSYTISSFVKEKKMDMLGIGYYKHSPGGSIFREAVVKKIDRHLSFPLLVMPTQSRSE
ncbi:universal stress protein [Christiangramia sabulilitoris]|uniref:Universal stress protein n=1 Tax=Christiangramia sabulilitoris TaxID=2583991 RepID=A0A550I7M2_9FLAO|nr:universal stress protein [Christiangramia sabulilitoris]TRO66972.1 universal stress protein [Christiangramia sabulilitoris]